MKTCTKVLLGVAGVATLGYLAAGYAGLMYGFKRKDYKGDHPAEKYHPLKQDELDYINSLEKKTLSMTSFDGLNLKATFFPSETPSDKVVICIHGYHSTGMIDYKYFIHFYHEHGFHILIPDDRAHGESEGKYIGFGYLDRHDVMSWIFRVQELFDFKPLNIMLHGLSMGSSTVLMASGEDLSTDVKCIIADCGYSNAVEQFTNVLKKNKIPSNLILSSAGLLSEKVIGYDFRKIDVIKQVSKSSTPTLFIHGDADNFVDFSMVKKLYEACSAEKELFVVPGAHHVDSYIKDKKGYEKHILDFYTKYFQ